MRTLRRAWRCGLDLVAWTAIGCIFAVLTIALIVHWWRKQSCNS